MCSEIPKLMTELIACLSKNNWPHVSRLIKDGEWEKVILITDKNGKENFKPEKKVEYVAVDFTKPVFEVIKEIQNGLKGKVNGIEVAVNIVSGTGKEHMAILSALLKIGVGVRFMAVTREGIKEI